MKIAFYNPYWHILGGGERYLLSIAEYLSRNHEVFLFADDSIKNKARAVFNISLNRVNFLPLSTIQTKNLLKKYYLTLKYDIFFYMTDGSLFIPMAKKNFLVIQSPAHLPILIPLNRLKVSRWKIVCYSQFMRNIIEDKINKEAYILSPCIDPKNFEAKSILKENIILTVGRFFSSLHNKKQEVLLDVFKKNYQKYFKGWKLIIAGGLTEEGGNKPLARLMEDVDGFPIEIIVNPTFDRLIRLYQAAKIYWHAAGFGEDEKLHPERMEHFGITTLEAMASGTVPLVYKGGGQTDIVQHGQNGFLWQKQEELIRLTYDLITNNKQMDYLSKNAVLRAQDFSCQSSYEKVDRLIFK